MKGRRDEMEDAHSIEQNQRFVFLAVFDGHDGKDVSEFMGKNLWKYFTDSPHLTVEEKLATAAQRCERQMLVDRKLGGSTAAVCVFDKIDGILHVWNVGDSEIMIVPDTGAYQVLSEMHRGETPSERQRIERIPKGSSYIKVEVNRVNQKRETRVAGYGVSRAFGDFKFGKVRKRPRPLPQGKTCLRAP
jgi:serine/threonine protein phosphatase PrpC